MTCGHGQPRCHRVAFLAAAGWLSELLLAGSGRSRSAGTAARLVLLALLCACPLSQFPCRVPRMWLCFCASCTTALQAVVRILHTRLPLPSLNMALCPSPIACSTTGNPHLPTAEGTSSNAFVPTNVCFGAAQQSRQSGARPELKLC